MTGFLFALQIIGLAFLYIVVPLFSIFFGIILITMYTNHKMGRLHSWKEITSPRVSPNVIWADDFREVCELFLESPDDPRIQRVMFNTILESMTLIRDFNINPNRCELSGMSIWMLKEQLRVNLKDQYYVENWGDMPQKVV